MAEHQKEANCRETSHFAIWYCASRPPVLFSFFPDGLCLTGLAYLTVGIGLLCLLLRGTPRSTCTAPPIFPSNQPGRKSNPSGRSWFQLRIDFYMHLVDLLISIAYVVLRSVEEGTPIDTQGWPATLIPSSLFSLFFSLSFLFGGYFYFVGNI